MTVGSFQFELMYQIPFLLNIKAYLSKPTPMLLFFCTSFLIYSCVVPPKIEKKVQPPKIRVGILEARNKVVFKVTGKARYYSQDGSFALRGIQGGIWQVDAINARPAKFTYRLSLGTTKDRFAAERRVRFAANKGLSARIQKFDIDTDSSPIPYVKCTVYRIILNKEFASVSAAKVYQKRIIVKIDTEVVEEVLEEAQGTLRFTNLQNKYSFDSKKSIRMSATEIQIPDVEIGTGFHWASNESRIYGSSLEFLLDKYGLISVINELPIEEYLKGVVPSEMPPGFPLEALKAQAIAARVEALSKKGLRHPTEPFDLCDDVHCQVFSGKTKQAKTTDEAVESTHGILMVYRNKLAEAFYAGVCGGHTENNDNVWIMEPLPYCRGILDSGNRSRTKLGSSLQVEKKLKKWIDSNPDVYCNTIRKKVSSSLDYGKKYFRWKFEYNRKALEKIIHHKTGEDFGVLIDLIPLKRGISGRLIELEIVGSKKRFMISRELVIRQALSESTLYSACFYIKKEGRRKNLPKKFILKGAGWGHGVGMCQIGAAVMADARRKYNEILKHYYKGIILEKIY